MKKEITLFFKTKSIIFIFSVLVAACIFLFNVTKTQVNEFFPHIDNSDKFINQYFQSIYFVVPFLLGVVSNIFLGMEYNNGTMEIRCCFENKCHIIMKKIYLLYLIAFLIALVILISLGFYSPNHLFTFLFPIIIFLLICLLFVTISFIICVVSENEIFGLTGLFILWMIELKFPVQFSIKNLFGRYLQNYFGEYSDVVASGYTGTELYTLLFLVIISYLLLFILSNQQPRAS